MADRLQRRMRPLLGTFVEIGVAATDATDAGVASDAAFARIAQVHALLSFQDASSELSRLNRSQGDWVALSPLTLRVLRLAKLLGQKSSELFNVTVAGALVERGLLPNHSGRDVLLVGSSSDIEITATHARLTRSVLVTLDGIAKGYAVDLAIHALRCGGVRMGWINAGGDVRVFGDTSLHMQRRELHGALVSLGYLQNAALATSRTHADVANGYHSELIRVDTAPVAKAIVSVVAASAWRADALTKIAALLPSNRRQQTLEQLGGRLVAHSFSPSRVC
jgi:FAD:protein FMN transferase